MCYYGVGQFTALISSQGVEHSRQRAGHELLVDGAEEERGDEERGPRKTARRDTQEIGGDQPAGQVVGGRLSAAARDAPIVVPNPANRHPQCKRFTRTQSPHQPEKMATRRFQRYDYVYVNSSFCPSRGDTRKFLYA
jgi:hypothetical protein